MCCASVCESERGGRLHRCVAAANAHKCVCVVELCMRSMVLLLLTLLLLLIVVVAVPRNCGDVLVVDDVVMSFRMIIIVGCY